MVRTPNRIGRDPRALFSRLQDQRSRFAPWTLASIALLAISPGAAFAQPAPPPLPSVPFPAENQFSQAKSTLGKMLFWDAQLSSDNTTSCGSCHTPSVSGTDARIAIYPGADGIFDNADDILGSPGVALADTDDTYLMSVLYGLLPQSTTRQAQPNLMAMFPDELFWDGRATSAFIDPQTGETVIASGGALESQAVGPIVNDVEMAHMGRDWDEVTAKLASARPLALASDLPPDLAGVIETGADYPQLFAQAFGDNEITGARVAMAIATYQRTLVPDQTDYDAFANGDNTALTPQQLNGLNAFVASRCAACHTGAQFTGNGFRNIGLRPINEDSGRFAITANPADRGRFKVPSLRNVGLRDRFMHNGQLQTIGEVFDFYARRNGQVSFPQNRDPLLNTPIAFPPPVQNDIINFLTNALTDPRVADEQFPFDRPTLLDEQPSANPVLISNGIAGSGGTVPQMVAMTPPNLGNEQFKLGIDGALGGAQAWVAVSPNPPVDGLLEADELLGPIILDGSGAGAGSGTMHYPIPDIVALDGEIRYMQWIVADPAADAGLAASPAAQVRLFCAMHATCIDHCPADLSGDGMLSYFDVSAFLSAFANNDPEADFNGDGSQNFFDVSAFLSALSAGCA